MNELAGALVFILSYLVFDFLVKDVFNGDAFWAVITSFLLFMGGYAAFHMLIG